MINNNNFNVNKVSLTFSNEYEKDYQKYFFNDSVVLVRFALLILSLIYGIFGFLDTLLIKSHIEVFFIIRFAIFIPLLLLVFLLSFIKIFEKIWQYLLFALFVVGGLGIIVMVLLAPNEYTYYLGLMLVLFAGYFFIKLRFLFVTIAGWILVLMFNIVMLNFSNVSLNTVIAHNFFFVASNLIGMFGAYYIEFYYRRNYWLNNNLHQKAELLNEQKNKLDELVKYRTSELEESQKKINVLFESMSDMVVIHDLVVNENKEAINYIITDCNKAFTKITGIKKDDAINKGADKVYQSSNPPYLKEFSEVAISGNPIQFETYYDAMNKHFLISVIPLGLYKFATITMDITGLKLNEEELYRQNKELEIQYEEYMQLNEVLRQTNYDLELAKSKAEESDKLKTSFLQNMSHEIRTPLNEIIGFSNLLGMENLSDEDVKDFTENIKHSSSRILEIIHNVLEIAKIETKQLPIKRSEVSINSLLQDLYNSYNHYAIKKGLSLNYHLFTNDDISIINSDEAMLIQILKNLISNAIKFTINGSVDLGYEIKANKIYFYVKDTGIGIPSEIKEKIFDKFTQADDSISRSFEGAGIGLAICKGLVELLGGEIWVESEFGKGSTFTFSIPIDENN